MRTVIVQGIEKLPDGSFRNVEMELTFHESGYRAGSVEAIVISRGAATEVPELNGAR